MGSFSQKTKTKFFILKNFLSLNSLSWLWQFFKTNNTDFGIRILVRISWVWRRDKDETKIQKIFLSSKNLPRSGCFRLLGTLSDIMRHLIDLHLSNPSTFIVFLKFEKSIFYVLFNFWVIFIFVNFSKTCRLSSNVSNLFSL